MEEKIYSSSVNASLAHTCGNLTSIIFNHIKNKFPNHFFRGEHISTRIALKDYKRIRDSFLELKKSKPIIAVIPKIVTDQTEFNIDTQKRLYGPNFLDGYSQYQEVKFFKDLEKNIMMSFNVERIKMNFEFTYVVSTAFAQYNLAGYMLNTFRFDHPYYEQMIVEVEIPDVIIRQLSKDSGIPVFDENNKVAPFLKYLNTHSESTFIYKFKSSTGKYKFFMLLVVNVLIECDGRPNLDDGDKDGSTSDDFTITNTLIMESNYPSKFVYSSLTDNDIINDPDKNTTDLDNLSITKIIPLYTYQDQITAPYEGFEFYVSSLLETETTEGDETPIQTLFDMDMEKIIQYAREMEIDFNTLFKIRVLKDDEDLEKDNYTVDWDNMILTINSEINQYRLIIYKNLLNINFIMDKIHTK